MTRFDEAIPVALKEARAILGEDSVRDATIVRDVAGRISLILESEPPVQQRREAAIKLNAELGPYSPGTGSVLLRKAELIDPDDILHSPDRIRVQDEDIFLVDRLLTNQDWLRSPVVAKPPLPVAAGFSIKGGVGRSTALAVWAWHLARIGRNVVVVDLDLEAPGIALLLVDRLPPMGLVDWLAEDLAEQSNQVQLDDLLIDSPVADDTAGQIRVLPAFGSHTRDYITKLGRVTLAGFSATGESENLANRLVRLLTVLADSQPAPDVVLLDARAGLHDLAAAAVTQLGAEVFLFARDEEPSWQAYRLLFEHLRMSKAIEFGLPDHDLRLKMKMVGAQAAVTERDRARLVDNSFNLWTTLYDQREPTEPAFARDDPDAPHYPLTIYFEDKLRGLRLVEPGQRPAWSLIETTFSAFINGASERIALT